MGRHSEAQPEQRPAETWDQFYSESTRIWSGNPNSALVSQVAELSPGTALELGCGEGADAIWLAERGWQVTGIDVSGVALERAAEHALSAGVAESTDWERHDLALWQPSRSYDLVTALFLHSMIDFPREPILRAAAAAVAPGGSLLVVGHESFPPWSEHRPDASDFPPAENVAEALGLAGAGWRVHTASVPGRVATGPEGQAAQLTDSVLLARRPA
ncbi:class I SAM-dependent methyltransferase [Paeniglutamicibacter cryotolerans]|uniref:SAM-dependent methyltransferase n=1 Tax=Paeniglutamicibacter cryotolerans TaxID=670079 RepID=A0A839QMT7_9MICC|nr:class I SAM-dependent methyltransferase [Paeniglutamicibacter cryotolerans]MBB2996903.1 SAM-dependent methyltransferase [Paeniglutamicibacter cryotolerans]